MIDPATIKVIFKAKFIVIKPTNSLNSKDLMELHQFYVRCAKRLSWRGMYTEYNGNKPFEYVLQKKIDSSSIINGVYKW